MTNLSEEEKSELFKILTDYGDFFLTNYPNQSETKSIHPTMARIQSLVDKKVEEALLETFEVAHGDGKLCILLGDKETPNEAITRKQELRERLRLKYLTNQI